MAWFHSLANWIDRRGGKREILRALPDGGSQLYLERFYIFKSPFMEIMIHRFHVSDEAVLHDHPWASCSVILQTGYHEEVLDPNGSSPTATTLKFRGPGYIGTRSATDVHRVELLPGTEGEVWTVFITMRRKRKWGFITEDGWVAFDEYLKQRGTFTQNDQSANYRYKGWLFPVKVIEPVAK